MMSSHTQTGGKGEYPNIDRQETLEEFKKIDEQCKLIQDQLREKNEEVQRLKQNLLLSTGAKMALAKVLGIQNANSES